MTPIRIPKDSELGLVKVIELDDEAIESLIAALTEAPPTFHPEKLAEKITARIKEVSQDEITGIVSTLVSLYTALDYFDTSDRKSSAEAILELAENVRRAVAQNGIKGIELSGETLDRFRDRLIRLLSIDSIGIRSRAINLLLEQGQAFCGARILTDIRPLFASDLKAAPTAALVVHTLRISYHQGSELKQFYVAMDSEDIKALKNTLDRAESKADNLHAVLDAAKITCLDV